MKKIIKLTKLGLIIYVDTIYVDTSFSVDRLPVNILIKGFYNNVTDLPCVLHTNLRKISSYV